MEERGIREDKGTAGAEDHPYTQVSYITCISECIHMCKMNIFILKYLYLSPGHIQKNLVTLLESSMGYLEQAQRYEVMPEVAKLLQPFYEEARDSKVSPSMI